MVVLLLIACTDEDKTSVAYPDSPPPVDQPSAKLLSLSMESYVTGDVELVTMKSLADPDPEGKEFKVQLQDESGSGSYVFSPSQFSFKVGESINFVLNSETEFHTFTIDKLDIDAAVDVGETVSFNVKFDRAGVFDLVCIPHQTQGMVSTITVSN